MLNSFIQHANCYRCAVHFVQKQNQATLLYTHKTQQHTENERTEHFMVDYIYGKIYDTLRTLKVTEVLEVVALAFYRVISFLSLCVCAAVCVCVCMLRRKPTSGYES